MRLLLVLGLDDRAPFAQVMRQRLLDVHVLARLARVDGDRHVPVIRRADEHGVDVLAVEDSWYRLVAKRLRVGELLAFFQMGVPDVADAGDADGWHLGQRLHQLPGTAAGTDDSDSDLLVGAESTGGRNRCSDANGLKKVAAGRALDHSGSLAD